MPDRVDIALTVYNGVRHLAEFVESLERQTYGNWRLVARDDGSTDGTADQLVELATRLGSRARLAQDEDGNLGVVAGFSRVLAHCDAPYVMWADADDVWLPTKIEATLRRLQELETTSAPDTPCMVFTDLVVVDVDLRPIAGSFWDFEKIRSDGITPNRLLSRGIVTGCTVMMNRELQSIVLPIPPEAVSHDWWASLLVALCGRIAALETPTLLYRQHGANDLGAKRRSVAGYLRRASRARRMVAKCVWLGERTRAQARAALERVLLTERRTGGRVRALPQDLEVVRRFGHGGEEGAIARKAFLWRHGIIREDPVAAVMKYLLW